MSLHEKLAAKNKAHADAKNKEYREYHLAFVIGVPLFLAIYYEIILLPNTGLQLQDALFRMFFSVIGLGAIAAFTLRLLTNHLQRLLILSVSNMWLWFFWVWSDSNLLGLLPVAVLYLATRIIKI